MGSQMSYDFFSVFKRFITEIASIKFFFSAGCVRNVIPVFWVIFSFYCFYLYLFHYLISWYIYVEGEEKGEKKKLEEGGSEMDKIRCELLRVLLYWLYMCIFSLFFLLLYAGLGEI